MKYALLTLAVALLAACSVDPTAPVARVPKVSADFNPALPAPVLQSAVIVGETDGLPLVRVSFLDTAEDEAKAIAYFTMADGSHSTQNASGIAGTGERTVDFYALPNVVSAQMYFMWKDASALAICGCVFGPMSNAVDVVDAVTAQTKRKGKR